MSYKKTAQKRFNSPKPFFKFVFGLSFAVLLIVMFYLSEIYKQIHLIANRSIIYIQPQFKIICILSLISAAGFYALLYFHNKILKRQKISKTKVSLISVLLIIIIIFCNLSYNYIDKKSFDYYNQTAWNTSKIFEKNEVEKINVSVEKSVLSMPHGFRLTEYYICCQLKMKNRDIIIESSDFNNYKYLYLYLKKFDYKIFYFDKTNFDQLYRYEQNNLFNSSDKTQENLKYIEQIFN